MQITRKAEIKTPNSRIGTAKTLHGPESVPGVDCKWLSREPLRFQPARPGPATEAVERTVVKALEKIWHGKDSDTK